MHTHFSKIQAESAPPPPKKKKLEIFYGVGRSSGKETEKAESSAS